jgi:hypothetical protein
LSVDRAISPDFSIIFMMPFLRDFFPALRRTRRAYSAPRDPSYASPLLIKKFDSSFFSASSDMFLLSA